VATDPESEAVVIMVAPEKRAPLFRRKMPLFVREVLN